MIKVLHLVLLLTILSAVVKANGQASSKIFGGSNVGRFTMKEWKKVLVMNGKFPYFTAVEFRKKFWCGGVIITRNLVITAAHCVKGKPGKKFNIRAGTFTKGDTTGKHVQTIRARQKYVHPSFVPNRNEENDIAILRLKSKLTFNAYVNAIKLAEATQAHRFNGKKGLVLGLGKIDGFQDTEFLQKGQMQILSREECKAADRHITENLICAKGLYGDVTTCIGDSGGPLILNHSPDNPENDLLVGITSFGVIKKGRDVVCDPKVPAAFADIAVNREWIDKIMDIVIR